MVGHVTVASLPVTYGSYRAPVGAVDLYSSDPTGHTFDDPATLR